MAKKRLQKHCRNSNHIMNHFGHLPPFAQSKQMVNAVRTLEELAKWLLGPEIRATGE